MNLCAHESVDENDKYSEIHSLFVFWLFSMLVQLGKGRIVSLELPGGIRVYPFPRGNTPGWAVNCSSAKDAWITPITPTDILLLKNHSIVVIFENNKLLLWPERMILNLFIGYFEKKHLKISNEVHWHSIKAWINKYLHVDPSTYSVVQMTFSQNRRWTRIFCLVVKL